MQDLAELQQVLVERMDRLYDWQVSPEELLFLPGVIVGLNLTCQSGSSGRKCAGADACLPTVSCIVAQNAGMERHDAMLERRSDGHYEIDWETFEAGLDKQTRMFILCNPHNPVGRVFRKDELEHMAELCLTHGVVICSDEIHCDLLLQGEEAHPHCLAG